MKKSILIFILTLNFTIFNSFFKNEVKAQTTSTTITYTGFLACGGCVVCGTDYYCLNTNSSYCGNTAACMTKTFTDPVPAGNIVTSASIQFFTADCNGGSLTGTINGNAVPTVNEGNTGCACSSSPCGQSAPTTTSVFNCGLPGYVYGGSNTFKLCTGANVCISHAIINLTYAPANQATPAVQPAGITGPAVVCPGTAYNYSASSSNAASYTWTVPAGWTINSGQGTSTINATPGSAGSICVKAVNLCGTSAQTCLGVTLNSLSTAPTGASANPNPICPSTPTTLSVSGGSLGTGATWNWYTGSCNGTLVGTGSSITVSPASATTYYVDAVGTCNTTACANVTVNVGGTTAAPGAPTGSSTVCGGSTQAYNTTGTSGATSYNWTVPAGATINSGQGTTSISVTMGSSSGNVCVTATGACGTSAASCTPVTITNAPSTPGGITGTTPVCIGSDSYSIASVAGATSYTWAITGGGSITGGQGTTNATVNWTTAGAYIVSVTASNACGTSTQNTFNLTVNPPPTISISSSASSVCSGSSATFTATGASSYTWANAATLSAATGAIVSATPVVSPTIYTVTGTDVNNCVNTNTVSLSINPTPTISIAGGGGNSQTVCGGGSVNNTVAGINFVVTPSGSADWTNSNTTIGLGASGTGSIGSYAAPTVSSGTSVTGVITVTATVAGCPSTSNSQLTYTVTINQIPGSTTATINPASCGVNDGTISGPTGTGGSGFYSYSWDNGATFSSTSSYTNGAGTYPVEIKDNTTGCIYSQNFTIPNAGAPAAPSVTASSTLACVGGSVILSVNSPVSGVTYNWTEANGNTGTGTTYTVVNIPASPNPYTIGVTGTSSGCTGAAGTTSVTVSPLPPPPTLTAPTGTNNAYCQGSPIALTVSSGTTTPTPIAVWYSGSTMVNVGNSFTPPANLPAGTYTYSVIDSIPAVNGCVNASASANTVTLSVTINPLPPPPVLSAPTGTNNSYCEGSPIPLTVTSGTNTAVWYSGNTLVNVGNSFTPPANLPAGTYTYSVIDSIPAINGCVNAPASANTVTLSVTVNALPPTPILTAPTGTNNSYCQGFPSPLTVNTGTNMAVWYSGNTVVNTGSSFTPPANLPAGTYTYSVIDSIPAVNGCINAPQSANTLTLTLVINPNPSIDVSGALSDTAKCGQPTGGVHGIANATGGTPYIHYQWTGPGTTAADTLVNLTNISSGGSYSLQITDANGCHASGTGLAGVNTFTIPSVASPVASFSTSPSPATGSVPLTVVFTNQTTGTTSSTGYIWNFGDMSPFSTVLSPTHTYTVANTYTATLIAYNGSCASSPASVVIIADVPTTIIIPNIFSPNGDTKNDEFFIVNTGMSSLNCQIFNRWGQLMHTLTAPDQSWDGFTPNGDKAPEGTYMFILQAQGLDGKTYKQQGTLTLVR